MKLIDLYPSRLFTGTEGDVFSELFNQKIHLEAKHIEEGYTRKAAELFLNMSDEMIRKIIRYTADYVLALIDDYGEDFYPDEDFDFDENTPFGRVMEYVEPVVLSIIGDKLISIEESEPAFRLTLSFTPIADEEIEWTVRGDEILYVGEAANTSPWDKSTFKKGWNFAE